MCKSIVLGTEWYGEWPDEDDPDYPTIEDIGRVMEYFKENNACYDMWGNKYYYINGRSYLDADGRIPIDFPAQSAEPTKAQVAQQKKENLFELEKQVLEKLKLIVIDGMLVYEYIYAQNYYCYLPDAMLYVEIRKCLEIDIQPNTMKKLVELLKSNPSIQHRADEFNSNPFRLNCKTGVLDFSEGKIVVLPHDPERLFSYCIDAEFLFEPQNTTAWDNYCQTTFPQETELHQKLLEEFMGTIYCDNLRCKCMFVGVGLPNTGKTVLAEHISRSCGWDNISNLDPKELASEFGRMQLYGKKANVVTELSAKKLPDPATLKKLTSGDVVTGAYKGKDAISFHNKAKLVFYTNVFPRPAEMDMTDAFINRVVPLIFAHRIPDSNLDPDLPQKLWDCRDSIFTKAMYALLRLFENNFKFTQPQDSLDFLRSYRAQLNSFAVFFANSVEITGDEDCIFTVDLFESYHNFCQEEGLEELKDSEIRDFLETQSNIKKGKRRRDRKGSPISCYIGCKFKNEIKDGVVLRAI